MMIKSITGIVDFILNSTPMTIFGSLVIGNLFWTGYIFKRKKEISKDFRKFKESVYTKKDIDEQIESIEKAIDKSLEKFEVSIDDKFKIHIGKQFEELRKQIFALATGKVI
ncbi:hypothetical protein LCGC14_0405150 [marine sediment metagenome]|uniref:Uncharacterized protein n=1 Tax=marine sediment metagenome TaxID=412755 RepID=A0A0F9VHG8_9ZZZZ